MCCIGSSAQNLSAEMIFEVIFQKMTEENQRYSGFQQIPGNQELPEGAGSTSSSNTSEDSGFVIVNPPGSPPR